MSLMPTDTTTGTTIASVCYLDFASGSDNNVGTAQATPWQTLAKVNATTFQPGDRILLKAGSKWSGAEGAPVTVTSYGEGAKPVIDGATAEAAISLEDQQHWATEKLELRNTVTERMVDGFPLFVNPDAAGDGMETLKGKQVQAGSPLVAAGAVTSDPAPKDFFGNPVPKQIPPAIGAHQRIVNN